MTEIAVRPATPDRFDDVATVVGGGVKSCWCLYYRLASAEYNRVQDREGKVRELLAGDTAPGMLAYLDEQVAGWCGIGPRAEMGRLMRSRTIQVIDDLPVWSVTCFVVRPGFRRRGVAHALLAGAVGYADEHEVPAVEAYPADPAGTRMDTSFAYVGTVPMFEAAGFERVAMTAAQSGHRPRWLMRRYLRGSSRLPPPLPGSGRPRACPGQQPAGSSWLICRPVSFFVWLLLLLNHDGPCGRLTLTRTRGCSAFPFLPPYLDRPFGFFGHCGGALPGVEVTRQLERAGLPQPTRVFVSSQVVRHDGPYGRLLRMDRPGLEDELAKIIRRTGGEPTEALLELGLDVLDAGIEGQPAVRAGPNPAGCGITAIGWTEDAEIPMELMSGWRGTSADVRYALLEGDHFAFLRAPCVLAGGGGCGIRRRCRASVRGCCVALVRSVTR
jgi:GNAT superfamily N-acetyltransferase